jgi:hypothetical protein
MNIMSSLTSRDQLTLPHDLLDRGGNGLLLVLGAALLRGFPWGAPSALADFLRGALDGLAGGLLGGILDRLLGGLLG